MAKTIQQPIIRVQETRDITYMKKSAFFGLINWQVQMSATHIANDIILILGTPIRKIMIDNNGKIQEIDLSLNQKE